MGLFDAFKKKKEEPSEPFVPFEITEAVNGEYEGFYNKLLKRSLIVLVTGKRGSGKTGLGMRLLETFNRKTKRKCYAVGFEKSKTPGWIKKVKDMEKVKNGSIVLVDEGAIVFSARESMKDANKNLGKLMAIARHKDLSLILITQSCLPSSTEVMTDNGAKKLSDIGEEDLLLSYNPDSKSIEPKRVAVSEPELGSVIELETEDGDIIKCSANHRFPVKDGDKIVMKAARDLTEKDRLFKPKQD